MFHSWSTFGLEVEELVDNYSYFWVIISSFEKFSDIYILSK